MEKKAQAAQTPDRKPLTASQAKRLAAITNLNAKELTGLSVAEISEKLRWQIDPKFLFFRRICGQVVKKDPVTGVEYPVPFATVYAEDTECSFLGLFPVDLPWSWFFPFWCYKEVIAETTTDACGKFCFWIPWFEIEWILRFRIERICFPDLFVKPTVGDVIQYLQGQPKPGPGPDPGPLKLRPGSALYQKAEQLLGTAVTSRLAATSTAATLGSRNGEQQTLLSRSAFPFQQAPPIPKEFTQRTPGHNREHHHKAVRETLATRLNLDTKQLKHLDLNRYYGPFLRCFDIIVPEWVEIIEVPDISFRVTQDVAGDGVQQVIYNDGLFDVNWGTGNIPDAVLVASPIARATTSCNVPNVPCSDVPAIEFAGLMPLINPPLPTDPYVEAAEGYATRPNRPHPSGLIVDPLPHPLGEAPYTRTLQLYGCNRVDGAANYRLLYSYNGGPTVPFTGITWPLYRVVGFTLETLWPAADSDGWYPVLAAADGWFPDLLLLEWDTTTFANGLYTVTLEVGDAAKNPIASSASVGFTVDNSYPVVQWTSVQYSLGGGPFTPIATDDCVVISRGNPPQDVTVQITYLVTASHLRSLQLGVGGCVGGANPTSAIATLQHWSENPADNSYSATATFTIPAADPPGVYSFDLNASSRAFNPAGSDGGHLADWNYDPVYNYVDPWFAIAVVNT